MLTRSKWFVIFQFLSIYKDFNKAYYEYYATGIHYYLTL